MVDVGAVAHGGFCVARHDGRAVFVRHALPGERVRARVTEGGTDDRFWRADAIEVVTASADRVEAPCPYAGPGRCGGCDWQHATLPAQRRLKAAVVAEQLRRLAGIERDVTVEAVPGDDDGLGWRTRVTYAVDAGGRAGLRQARSHDVVPIDTCLIAHPAVRGIGVEGHRWAGVSSVEAVASGTGEQLVVVDPASAGSAGAGRPARPLRLPRLDPEVSVATVASASGALTRVRGRSHVSEQAGGRTWRVTGGGFWQVHPGAADALVEAVLAALEPRPGERAFDLYCGVGLFAGALAERVGAGGSVLGVEGSRQAVADARRNLHDLPAVELVTGRVDRVLAGRRGDGASDGASDRADVVVLDPPRTGAKAAVVGEVARRRPRAVAYVACDPAALARDLALFAGHGYELSGLRAFDLFPMTHHVECVATLTPR